MPAAAAASLAAFLAALRAALRAAPALGELSLRAIVLEL